MEEGLSKATGTITFRKIFLKILPFHFFYQDISIRASLRCEQVALSTAGSYKK